MYYVLDCCDKYCENLVIKSIHTKIENIINKDIHKNPKYKEIKLL